MLKSDTHLDEVRSVSDTEINGTIIPTNNDVMCGRGKTHFFHEGNAKFREIVGAHLGAYLHTKTRSQKSKIVRDVADELLGQGTRFLHKKGKHDQGWFDGGVTTARAKVSA